jgi:hypothetical protein
MKVITLKNSVGIILTAAPEHFTVDEFH